MPELEDRLLPLGETASEARLAVSLIFKLLAGLKMAGKLDEEELRTIATSLIVELPSEQDRFHTWTLLESIVPDFKRPE